MSYETLLKFSEHHDPSFTKAPYSQKLSFCNHIQDCRKCKFEDECISMKDFNVISPDEYDRFKREFPEYFV